MLALQVTGHIIILCLLVQHKEKNIVSTFTHHFELGSCTSYARMHKKVYQNLAAEKNKYFFNSISLSQEPGHGLAGPSG